MKAFIFFLHFALKKKTYIYTIHITFIKTVHTLSTVKHGNIQIKAGERDLMVWSAAGGVLWLRGLQELIRIVHHF